MAENAARPDREVAVPAFPFLPILADNVVLKHREPIPPPRVITVDQPQIAGRSACAAHPRRHVSGRYAGAYALQISSVPIALARNRSFRSARSACVQVVNPPSMTGSEPEGPSNEIRNASPR